jgi:hypothetical protein
MRENISSLEISTPPVYCWKQTVDCATSVFGSRSDRMHLGKVTIKRFGGIICLASNARKGNPLETKLHIFRYKTLKVLDKSLKNLSSESGERYRFFTPRRNRENISL